MPSSKPRKIRFKLQDEFIVNPWKKLRFLEDLGKNKKIDGNRSKNSNPETTKEKKAGINESSLVPAPETIDTCIAGPKGSLRISGQSQNLNQVEQENKKVAPPPITQDLSKSLGINCMAATRDNDRSMPQRPQKTHRRPPPIHW